MTDDDMDYAAETERSESPDGNASSKSGKDENPSFLRWLLELVVMVALAFALATVVRTFVVQPYVIPSGSMIPTIEISERVLANKFIYRFETPNRGDIVVFDDPTKTVPTLIKRVIATEGETVDLIDGRVYVDGVALDEPYTYGKPSEPAAVPMPFTVPADQIWVMGDNRTNSADSRVFGAVPLSSVDGRAILRIWPLNRFAKL